MKKTKVDKELRRYRRQEIALRLLPIALPICVVLLLVAAALSVAAIRQIDGIQDNADKIEKTTDRLDRARVLLRDSELRACDRVNILRERVNRNASIIYRVLKAASSADSRNARYYSDLIRDVDYAPLTNCARAVDEARTYMPPLAIPYVVLDREGRFNDQTGEITPRRGRQP